MINKQNILDRLKHQPFQPFDIKTSDGRVYTLGHPEYLSLSHQGNVVYYVTDDDRLITIAMSQIVSLEVTNAQQAA